MVVLLLVEDSGSQLVPLGVGRTSCSEIGNGSQEEPALDNPVTANFESEPDEFEMLDILLRTLSDAEKPQDVEQTRIPVMVVQRLVQNFLETLGPYLDQLGSKIWIGNQNWELTWEWIRWKDIAKGKLATQSQNWSSILNPQADTKSCARLGFLVYWRTPPRSRGLCTKICCVNGSSFCWGALPSSRIAHNFTCLGKPSYWQLLYCRFQSQTRFHTER